LDACLPKAHLRRKAIGSETPAEFGVVLPEGEIKVDFAKIDATPGEYVLNFSRH
jgi:hypothetical protein